jgi:KUP system potassium uptake protein
MPPDDPATPTPSADAEPGPSPEAPPAEARRKPAYLLLLSLGALGVVYGDIGTSPLYAIRESFSGHFGVEPTTENVLGVLSLITWSLVLIVAVKYLLIVLRADNEGEGGILALTTLVSPPEGTDAAARRSRHRGRVFLAALGIFGAALLYGDGMLTPAISVLSAVEGLGVVQPSLSRFVVPITVAIILALFLYQRRGTAHVGKLFGPVTLVWFLTLAALGVRGILLAPEILAAANPVHAVAFFSNNGLAGVLVLGAVFLVVTGGEALYADLGHFGRGPIQLDWFAIVMPALLLNYYGQGALVLSDPTTTTSPFFLLAPHWALIPLIVLSTAATIIASQAVITGVFSLTMQAVQLGYWPRLEVRHTSPQEYGQIYVPPMNWLLMFGTVVLVVAFGSSSALAAAYGVAIVCTMLVTTILLYVVLPERWGWPPWLAALVVSVFLVAELAFFAANVVKIHEGGWVSLAVAALVYVVMTTWRDGRRTIAQRIHERVVPLDSFLGTLAFQGVVRVRGNAIYMTSNAWVTPPPLLMMIRHQHALHKRVVILTVENVRAPHVPRVDRLRVQDLGGGFYRVVARYGFMETPNVLRILERLRERGLDLPLSETTFFLGRERLLPIGGPVVARWRMGIFSFLSRNSQRATSFFNIPADRVVEVGSQIEV